MGVDYQYGNTQTARRCDARRSRIRIQLPFGQVCRTAQACHSEGHARRLFRRNLQQGVARLGAGIPVSALLTAKRRQAGRVGCMGAGPHQPGEGGRHVCQCRHEDNGAVFIYSRQGTMFPMEKFESLASAVQNTLDAGIQNHGEMLVTRGGVVLPRQKDNNKKNSVLKGGDFSPDEVPIFMVWDQIPLTAVKPKGKHARAYVDRLRDLIRQLGAGNKSGYVQLIPTRIVKSLKEAYAHAAEIMLRGGEGTILKYRNAIWKDSTSKEQVKLKLEFTVDLQIEGVVLGRDNAKNAG